MMSNGRDISKMKESQVAKAWVNFAGNDSNSSLPIRDSLNVTSVTDISSGTYVINFDTPFANSDWVMAANGKYSKSSDNNIPIVALDRRVDDSVAINSNSARLCTVMATSTPSNFVTVDVKFCYALFYGELS